MGDNYSLQMTTLHQAATILDLFISVKVQTVRRISEEDFELYALTSIMIAAKMLEKDDDIPRSG